MSNNIKRYASEDYVDSSIEQIWFQTLNEFETKENATTKLEEAKEYVTNDFLNLYIWEKYDNNPKTYSLTEQTSAKNISYHHQVITSYNYDLVQYSNTILVRGNNIALINPVEIIISPTADGKTLAEQTLKNKFIKIERDNNYYFVSDSTEFGNSSGSSEYRVYIRNYQLVTTSSNRLGFITSTSADTYPIDGTKHTDNYYYIGGNQIGDALIKI